MKKVLIIEDEVIIALRFKTYFQHEGYIVTDSVTTGEEAIISATENPPELLITDINLAGEMNGLDAVENIYTFSKIPVIFVTGYNNEEYQKRSEQFNTIGFFQKPVDLEFIAMKLQEFLKK